MGRGLPHQLRPDRPPEHLRQGPDLLRPGERRALHPLCRRALPGRRPVTLAFLVDAYDEEVVDAEKERRPHRPAPPPRPGPLQVRCAAPVQEAGRQGPRRSRPSCPRTSWWTMTTPAPSASATAARTRSAPLLHHRPPLPQGRGPAKGGYHERNQKKFDKTLPGKDQGYSLAWCLAHDRLYSREVPGLLPYLYIIPFFLAYLVLDFSLRFTYRGMGDCGGEVSACLPVHPGLGSHHGGAGLFPAQGPPVVFPVCATGHLRGHRGDPQRVYERLPPVLLLFGAHLRGHGEFCGRLLYQHQLEGGGRLHPHGAADDDLGTALKVIPPSP